MGNPDTKAVSRLPKPPLKASFWAILAVIGIALFVRIPLVGEIPGGFFVDEASTGYDAYSLLETGKDQHGVRLPMYARSLGDYNEALYRYLAVPSVAVFGLNEFSVRLPAAIAGILSVLLVMLIAKQWWGMKAALLAGVCLALCPWHVHQSLIAFRAILLPLCVLAGQWAFLRALRGPPCWLYVSAFAFALSLWTYSSARVFVPAYVLALIWFYRKYWTGPSRTAWISALGFASALAAFSIYWFSGEGLARAQQVGWAAPGDLLRNYLSYFSPDFLVFHGDPAPRHGSPDLGQLGWLWSALAVAGLLGVLLRIKKIACSPWIGCLLAWLVLYPLPAALTAESHGVRSIMGAPLFALLAGFGAEQAIGLLKSTKVKLGGWALLGILICVDTARNGMTYMAEEYPFPKSQAWLPGVRELIQTLELEPDEPVWMSQRIPAPFLFIPFYTQYPPEEYQSWLEQRGDSNWYEPYDLGRYHIAPISADDLRQHRGLFALTDADWQALKGEAEDSVEVLHTVSAGPLQPALYWVVQTR